MGKATRLKQELVMEAKTKVMSSFANNNRIMKQRACVEQPSLFKNIEAYQPFFIKDVSNFTPRTKSKNLDKQLLLLVREAFAKYSVCLPLTSIWEVPAANQDNRNLHNASADHTLKVDFKMWYICVARGGSLYKEHAKEYLSKKEVHNFTTCPHNLNIPQALVYCVAKAANTTTQTEGIALRIARSKLQEVPFNNFWKTVIRFFAEHTPKSIDSINDLIDYITHRYQTNNTFSMAGKTLSALEKSKMDWHYALRRTRELGNTSWTGCYIPNDTFEVPNHDKKQPNIIWSFEQILTGKRLAEEGNKMRHCVLSYKARCISGAISIWSLQKQENFGLSTSKVTIELSNQGNIRQARGLANRSPRPEENHAIDLWRRKYDLSRNHY